jgi:flavin-dependent dehydrogenase
MLRGARRRGIRPEIVVLEGRRALADPESVATASGPASCNFCAGGISPPLNDALDELGLPLPSGVIQNHIHTITIQSHWKHIELKVPEARRLVSVYRGSRPRARAQRELNFDAFLLDRARSEGADVRCARVSSIRRDTSGRPEVEYTEPGRGEAGPHRMTADFLAFAGGVNQVPGMDLGGDPLVRDLATLMPGFRPPRIRRALIFEVDVGRETAARLEGELYFVLFGSRDLKIDMGSVMPKGRYATVVLLGPDIDRHDRSRSEVIRAFLGLPHIRRMLPGAVAPSAVDCVCAPNLVVGPARRPFGERVAVIGDMVTSRLYKDGLHSAYRSATALADALLSGGMDAHGLRRHYRPAIRSLDADHGYGRLVFAFVALSFRRPVLSRVTYQAVLSERRTRPAAKRRLENILWKIASGDGTYRSVFKAMASPGTLLRFFTGGLLATVRNYLTEFVFGLPWQGFERFPTGVPREEQEERVRRIDGRLGLGLTRFPVRRLYAIRIRAPARRVYRELLSFGAPDRSFFRPRFVRVGRLSGEPGRVGAVIRYDVALRFLSFSIELEHVEENGHLLYRVRDGFARRGVLVFDIEERGDSDCTLTILVAFRIRGRGSPLRSLFGFALRALFPVYVHDVLWNHALCELKHAVETTPAPRASSASPP